MNLRKSIFIALFAGSLAAFAGCSQQAGENNNTTTTDSTLNGSTGNTGGTEQSLTLDGVLNANLATKEEMLGLPHMTDAIAQSILDKRPFMGMDQLHPHLKVSLNDEQLKELYVKFFLPINLNTASREMIMLVPGIGEKMAHEFEEYRPYTSPAQFRREIGKYVDEAEVARFEQYVFVPVELNSSTDEHIMTIPGMGKKMLHEFKEYRPYKDIAQFDREIGKYVDEKELARLRYYVYLAD
jgi:DNA uptake protein ComE-like DNA-binding protein